MGGGPIATLASRRSTVEFIIHPELPAVDIRRARTWYKDKLDLEPIGAGPDDEELLYDIGTAKFGVYQSPHAGKNLATAARLVTADFDDVHAQLRANGVEFEWYPIEGTFNEPGDDVLMGSRPRRTIGWFVARYGEPDVLEVVEEDLPRPRPGEVCVRRPL